ncbi:MAG: hypothetical protein GXZ05_09620 [Gammaproteobacteria bacterium]|nr:hypothetical protein [Gammaproteobacteria bacterium]
MSTELIELDSITEENAPTIYVAGGLQKFIDRVREEVAGEVPDLSTKKGRDRIASLAYSISRSKSAVEKPGRDYLRKLKEMPKVVEAELREFVTAMDALRDEVRAPLNEWEAVEKSRKRAHEQKIDWLNNWDDQLEHAPSEIIKQRMAEVEAVELGESWQEYEAEAARAKDKALTGLRELLAVTEQREAEQAELERLRQEAAEREQKEREERIAREAAEKARQEQAEALAKAQAEKELAEQRRIAAEKQAELDRIEAQARAKQQAEAAAQAERDRIAAEQAKADAEKAAREADREHQGNINRAAMEAIQQAGSLSDEQAREVIRAIVKGQVPNVTINY